MNNGYVNIHHIIEKLHSTSLARYEWNESDIKEWVFEAIRKINNKNDKLYSVKVLEVTDYTALIPVEVETILEVYDYEESKLMNGIITGTVTDNSYFINNGTINVSFETGFLQMTYLETMMDETGPLIPNENYYISAVTSYVQYKVGERAFFSDKMGGNQFNYLEREWLFYLPAVRGNNRLSILKDATRFQSISKKFTH